MFRMYACNSHSYTRLILALGIVRKPTVRGFITLNILAHMTLAGLLVPLDLHAVQQPTRAKNKLAGCRVTVSRLEY